MATWLQDDWHLPTFSFPFSIFLSLQFSPPPAITPLPLTLFISSWIITFLAFRVLSVYAFFYFPRCTTPPHKAVSTSLPFSSSICHFVMQQLTKKTGAQKQQTSHNHTVRASAGLLVPYRSRPRDGHGAGVAAPPLWRLPVLFVGSFKHLLHIADLVLAHGWHVYVAPEQSGKARLWISDVWQQTPSDKLLVILWQVAPECITRNARGTFRNQKYME